MHGADTTASAPAATVATKAKKAVAAK